MSTRIWNVLAVIAVAYLGVMALAGDQMKQAQFVAFEAQGLVAEDPATISAVRLRRGEATVALSRSAAGWTREGVAIPAELQPRVDLAVKFLHTAKPVRRMKASSMGDVTSSEIGLDARALTVSVTLAGGREFTFALGASTQEGSLQYLGVAGEDHVYLMSGFFGEEWAAVWAGMQ